MSATAKGPRSKRTLINAEGMPPSLYQIGKQVAALADAYEELDKAAVGKPACNREVEPLDIAMSRNFKQQEALVDLGLAMVPADLRDVAAQMVFADRRLDSAIAYVTSIEDAMALIETICRMVRCSMPIIADAAGINLTGLWLEWENFCLPQRDPWSERRRGGHAA